MIVAQALIFGPLERLKIVLQVNPLVKYANPASDRPKNFVDLCQKVTYNQGMMAFFRGSTAFVYKLVGQYTTRFLVYDHLMGKDADKASLARVLAAGTCSALLTTLLMYPLDLAHGRMAADMSKKPALSKDHKSQGVGKANRKTFLMQHQASSDRLYESVLDCLQNARQRQGQMAVYAGLPVALAAQIPYTVTLLTTYELCHRSIEEEGLKFNRYDDYTFLYKFLQRFGASTLAVTLATALTYPLDTLKRMYQLEGSLGHASRPGASISMARHMWLSEGGFRGFYRGFGVAMAKAVPFSFVQYLCFHNLRMVGKSST